MNHDLMPEATPRLRNVGGPVDGFLGTVALVTPYVAEAATSEGSVFRYVLDGVAAGAALLLVSRFTRAEREAQAEQLAVAHSMDLFGQL